MKATLVHRAMRASAALVLLLLSGTVLTAQSGDSPRITQLLQQAKEHAVLANRDAESIESFTRSRASWSSHANHLNTMKDHVNALGEDVAELTAARSEGSPWQQRAIDDVDPLLRSMADHLTAMIQHLSANQNRVHMPPYVEYAKANYQLSDRMLSMIGDYIDYGEAIAKAEALEEKLELPSVSEVKPPA